MLKIKIRKAGLRLTSEAYMKASQTRDGNWVVWLELEGSPLTDDLGKPKLFEGPTRYQAQCKAYKWYSAAPVITLDI